MKLKIDEGFKSLIPPLQPEEYQQLEANILQEGVRDALVTWNGVLIDGHNRYAICQKHALTFPTVQRDFESRDDALMWIIRNQLGRRNITAFMRGELALQLKPLIAAKAKANQGQRTDLHGNNILPNLAKSNIVNTRKELADASGVSHGTMDKIERIVKDAPEPIKAKARSGEVSTHKAYQVTTFLTKVSDDLRDDAYALFDDDLNSYEELAKHDHDIQRKMIASVKSGDAKTIRDAKRLYERNQRKQKQSDAIEQASVSPVDERVTILHGDVFDMLNQIPDNSINLLATDPPYNMNKFDGDSFEQEAFIDFTRQWLKAVIPKMATEYHMFISFASHLFSDLEMIVRDLQLPIQSRLIWHYRNAGGKSSGKYGLSKTYEPILHIGNRVLNLPEDWDDRRFDVWTIAVPQAQYAEGKWHPTQKPLELMQRIIDFGSYPDEHVLDLFAGSGTTGVAALNLGRYVTLIENNQEYVNAIKARISTNN